MGCKPYLLDCIWFWGVLILSLGQMSLGRDASLHSSCLTEVHVLRTWFAQWGDQETPPEGN